MSDVGRISEGWADEARSAALDARKRAHPNWHWNPTKAERKLGIVHVDHSDLFGGPHVADFQSFTPDGRHANVSLHLPDDHPAVHDAQGDFPGMHPDHFEWLDTVPVRRVTAHGRNVPELGRQHANEVTGRVQAAQRAEVVRQNQQRRAEAARMKSAGAAARRAELNAGLRTPSRSY